MNPGPIITDHIHSPDGDQGGPVMNKRWYVILIFFSCVVLPACTTPAKFAGNNIDLSITPQQVIAESAALQNVQVLWGGVIISSVNLKDATQFEILAYPLTSEQRPDMNRSPMGRFLALQEGYLEITDYAPGRLMTVSGTLQDKRSGHIGENEYIYPVLNIDQLQLWEKRSQRNEPQFHFGLGVMF